MRKMALLAGAVGFGALAGGQWSNTSTAADAVMGIPPAPVAGFAATPGVIGGQDMFGPYDIVKDWPKDISTVPGNEKWTWGAGQSIFAESPDRIYVLQRGELPNIKRPATKKLDEFGPSVLSPTAPLPYRDATVSSPPAAGGTGQDPKDGMRLYYGKLGV